MPKRRRRGALEINLTSLLDVLFCILFIVMLANAQNEREIKEDTQEQIRQLQEQVVSYKNQVDVYENQAESFDIYHTQAVIITMSNIVEDNSHKLLISEGDNRNSTALLLGVDRVNHVTQRIQNMVSDAVAAADNQPVYIVFHCNRTAIYTKEYNGIMDVLTGLQNQHKEVFYQIMEASE